MLKGVTETAQNEIKKQKWRFLSMLLGTSSASLLGNILAGKGGIPTSCTQRRNKKGRGINRAGEGFVRFAYGNKNNKMGF